MTDTPGTKYCSKCDRTLVTAEFSKKNRKCGLDAHCKACKRAYAREWGLKNSKKRSIQGSLQRRGLTPCQYTLMRIKADDRCEICRKVCPQYTRLAIDHDHETNKVRGLLCHHCNTALGGFRDDSTLLSKATRYLETHTPT